MRVFWTRALIGTAFWALAGPSFAQTSGAPTGSERIGTFKQVQGDIWVGTADQRRTPVSGDAVVASQRLATGKTGAATLTLKDGTVLTIGPDSTMDLAQFDYNPTTQEGNFLLDLLQGSVRVVTGLLGKANPDKFKVKTPTSVVGVRGTDFIVSTQGVD